MHGIMIQEGSAAYYEEVPRYKCPYTEDAVVEWWHYGWDQAQKEHELFTENQSLKAENASLKEQLEVQKMELQCDIDFANECVERYKEDKKIFSTAFDISGDKIEELRSQTVEISSLLSQASSYLDNNGTFSFRREKMKKYMFDLRVLVTTMKDTYPEKITKSENKP